MKERPILFKGEMVRAILEGRKTMTRRVVKPQPSAGVRNSPFVKSGLEDGHGSELRCPYGKPGDRLWVREAWQSNGLNWGRRPRDMRKGAGPMHYAATDNGEWKSYWGGWKPSIHMPRWASRILLEVTDVRVERLQDISEADAAAEGLRKFPFEDGFAWAFLDEDGSGHASPRGAFRALWQSINGPDSWAENPFVLVVSFRRVGGQPMT